MTTGRINQVTDHREQQQKLSDIIARRLCLAGSRDNVVSSNFVVSVRANYAELHTT